MTSRTTRPARTSTPQTWASVRAGAKAIRRTTRLCLDGDLLAEIDALNEQFAVARLDDGRLNRPPVAPKIAAEIVELTELARASEVAFTFETMGRLAWRDLVAKHPPTAEQRKAGADFNVDTFPVAAMAACCIEPTGVDFDEVAAMVTDGQWNKLWLACHEANTGTADVPFSAAAFATVRPTETNSGSREATESPEASS